MYICVSVGRAAGHMNGKVSEDAEGARGRSSVDVTTLTNTQKGRDGKPKITPTIDQKKYKITLAAL
jgi:hypothetical protein